MFCPRTRGRAHRGNQAEVKESGRPPPERGLNPRGVRAKPEDLRPRLRLPLCQQPPNRRRSETGQGHQPSNIRTQHRFDARSGDGHNHAAGNGETTHTCSTTDELSTYARSRPPWLTYAVGIGSSGSDGADTTEPTPGVRGGLDVRLQAQAAFREETKVCHSGEAKKR